jgi:hypothetical protein
MTREEQIQKLIDEENGIENYGSSDYQMGVCDGVRFADKTMIDKACKWLEQYQESYDMYDSWSGDYVAFKSLIIDFRKSMEE